MSNPKDLKFELLSTEGADKGSFIETRITRSKPFLSVNIYHCTLGNWFVGVDQHGRFFKDQSQSRIMAYFSNLRRKP